MINEAAYALMEGVASAEDIDKGMTLVQSPHWTSCLADLISIDVCLAIWKHCIRNLGILSIVLSIAAQERQGRVSGAQDKARLFIYE